MTKRVDDPGRLFEPCQDGDEEVDTTAQELADLECGYQQLIAALEERLDSALENNRALVARLEAWEAFHVKLRSVIEP